MLFVPKHVFGVVAGWFHEIGEDRSIRRAGENDLSANILMLHEKENELPKAARQLRYPSGCILSKHRIPFARIVPREIVTGIEI
ncbi:hypothetical protein B5P46_23725 [Rhizobium leguminosarum]|uniref:Uncharacterized protein n=1 Tax=Rhizobium leguminosarum TaxID=384 RepID=A0A4Q1TSI8_RHILE|nr:hypothetical protein B5P46_23725 [Rhizobium leguminosarum]